jgi:tetratricopeptide (TPR) repeat protein
MDLRPPQLPVPSPPSQRGLYALLLAILVLLGAVGLAVWPRPSTPPGEDPARRREVAAKLQAAGALDEAAAEWARYLEIADRTAEERAGIAYSLGNTLLEAGRYEAALRWFYEAEGLGGGALAEELGQRIVHCLERLGRHHAAEAAMSASVAIGRAEGATAAADSADPVVARIGSDEIRRSRLEQALDDGPPELRRAWSDGTQRPELLRRYIAEELVWRRALKLELDDDPRVRRRHAGLLKQLVVAEFVERELVAKIQVDETDLRTWYQANESRYGGDEAEPRPFDEVRQLVERDYRLMKLDQSYQRLVESELGAAGVELFPESLGNGS